jgi:cell wall-associated NlpC family hydrolase
MFFVFLPVISENRKPHLKSYGVMTPPKASLRRAKRPHRAGKSSRSGGRLPGRGSKCIYRFAPAVIFLVAFGGLAACGVASRTASGPGVSPPDASAPSVSSPARETSRSLRNVQRELYRAHDEWKGTPYVLGGSSPRGVDCSSLMQIIFERHFGMDMPRHTSEQIRQGRGVRRSAIRPGDLIFFRTTRTALHVGVALNSDEFLHASTSSGVMISSLSEQYWSSRYLGARRVL